MCKYFTDFIICFENYFVKQNINFIGKDSINIKVDEIPIIVCEEIYQNPKTIFNNHTYSSIKNNNGIHNFIKTYNLKENRDYINNSNEISIYI